MDAQQREYDLEGCALSHARTFNFPRPAVEFNHPAHHSEPESKAPVPARTRRVGLAEAVEDAGQQYRINTLPRVFDGDLDVGFNALQPHFNIPAFGCELDRVG